MATDEESREIKNSVILGLLTVGIVLAVCFVLGLFSGCGREDGLSDVQQLEIHERFKLLEESVDALQTEVGKLQQCLPGEHSVLVESECAE